MALAYSGYKAARSGASGRGPTNDISPLRTLSSCGSSLSLVRRRIRPKGVTRESFSGQTLGPAGPVVSNMVRNLYILKSLPSLPRRSQRYKIGPRESRLINRPITGKSGSTSTKPTPARTRSRQRFIINQASTLDMQRERYRERDRRIAIHKRIRCARLRYVIDDAPSPGLISSNFYDSGQAADLRRQRGIVIPQGRCCLVHIGVIIRTVDWNKRRQGTPIVCPFMCGQGRLGGVKQVPTSTMVGHFYIDNK